jgi:subtilisin family serine protease
MNRIWNALPGAVRHRPIRLVALAMVLALTVIGAPSAAGAGAAGNQPCSAAWLYPSGRPAVAPQAVPAVPLAAPGAASEVIDPEPGPSLRPLAAGDIGPRSVAPPNDDLFGGGQINSLLVMKALDAWETTYGGDDVTIAVISDGLDLQHPDLDGRVWHNPRERANGVDDDGNGYIDDLNGWDFGERDGDVTPVGPRGTLLAGIVGAETNNKIGVAAIDWNAHVMPLKVYKPYTAPDGTPYIGAYPEDFTRSVCYAANNGARVILFSLFNFKGVQSADSDLERLRLAINYAYDRGVMTVAPAGDCGLGREWCPAANELGVNMPTYPAVYNNVIGVQGFQPGYGLRETASHGSWVDISAPGEGYYTTQIHDDEKGDYYRIKSTTYVISDFAAAEVAGVVALMMTANPDYSLDRIQQTLCEGASRTVGGPYDGQGSGPYYGARNERYGCGLLDAERAVESMPWKVRVTPADVVDLTDGSLPGPSQDFSNPYLNAIAWELRPDVPWIRTQPVNQRPGNPSVGTIVTDIAGLPSGMLQAGRVHTEILHACTVGSVATHCQEIRYGLRFVDRLSHVLLPSLLQHR